MSSTPEIKSAPLITKPPHVISLWPSRLLGVRTLLLPFKDKDVGLTPACIMHGHRQSLEIGRKFDLPCIHDLAPDLVGPLQTVPVYPPRRGHRTRAHVRALIRIIFPVKFHVFRVSLRGSDERKPVPLVGLHLQHENQVHWVACSFPGPREA